MQCTGADEVKWLQPDANRVTPRSLSHHLLGSLSSKPNWSMKLCIHDPIHFHALLKRHGQYRGPSRGCDLCRKRRIKCDQRRPGCQKCSIYGVPCPGYNTTTNTPHRRSTGTGRSYVWHTASSATSSSSSSDTPSPPLPTNANFIHSNKSGVRSAEVITSESTSQSSAPTGDFDQWSATSRSSSIDQDTTLLLVPHSSQRWNDDDAQVSSRFNGLSSFKDMSGVKNGLVLRRTSRDAVSLPFATINSPPSADLFELSICHFFSSGALPIFQSIGPEVGSDSLIKQMYNASPDSCLRKAIRAAALVNYSNRFHPDRCESLVYTEYGRAIKSLKTALEDPIESRKDSSLIAALMVALYEFYVAINPQWTIKNWTHHGDGVRAILRVRGKQMLASDMGRFLFMLTHVGCNWVSLLAGSTAADDFLYDIEDEICLHQVDSSFPARSCVRKFFNDVTKLQARANAVLEAEAPEQVNAAVIGSFLQEIQILDLGIAGWFQIVPGWQTMPMTEMPRDYAFSSVLALWYYPSLTIFLHYIMVFAAQIKLHECAINLLRHLEKQEQKISAASGNVIASSAIMDDHIQIIRSNLSAFFGSIAYGLGDIDKNGRLRDNNDLRQAARRTSADNRSGSKLRSMEIFVPLAALQYGDYLDLRQRAACKAVLQRIQDDFRTR